MIEDTLTSRGLIDEATEVLRSKKASSGRFVEKLVADRKLQQIVKPETTFDEEAPQERGLDIFIDNLLQDYESVEEQKPGILQAVRSMVDKTKEAIRKDMMQTTQEYGELNFSEETDPTIVASNSAERSAILEAAQLLGYQIIGNDGESVKVIAQQRHELSGDSEQAIANRVNVGVRNLLEDHDSMSEGGIMRRPVRRQIVAMADHMTKTLRGIQDK